MGHGACAGRALGTGWVLHTGRSLRHDVASGIWHTLGGLSGGPSIEGHTEGSGD